MIKFYVNDRLICIPARGEQLPQVDLMLRLSGEEETKELQRLIESFENNNRHRSLALLSEAPDKTWARIKNIYIILQAAGGIVFNKKNELLMIFRNEKWDLPKGKVEANETSDAAAIREVKEECGLSNLTITAPGIMTYHTYSHRDRKILKCTCWYRMSCSDDRQPVPQIEEGITEVKWMNTAQTREAAKRTYSSIANLLADEKVLVDSGML